MSTIGVAAALTAEHAEHLAQFRIPPEMLDTVGVRSVTDIEARELLGINGHRDADLCGILFPYRCPVTGERRGGRIRLDAPLADGGKYISEPGCRHFFFAPSVADFLRDTRVPAIFVEAEKSVLAVTALVNRAGRKFLVIGIGGCWGWKRKIGKKLQPDGNLADETGPSPDFDLILWQGRTTILAFDSNALINPKVQRARRTLTKELSRRQARVLVAEVPAVEGVNGPDDLIALHGDEVMLALLDSPTAAERDVIKLERGKLPDAIDQAEKTLLGHSERLRIFQRAGEVVRAVSLPEPRKGGGLQRPSGTVQLEPLGGVALTEVFDRIVEWRRISESGDERVVDCPTRIATSYLSRTGSWRIPVLEGIIFAPIMRNDGTIVSRPGYDEETGLFFISDGDWLPVPDRPTRADAEAAVEILKAPFEEFPFIAAEDWAVHLASILTAIQRRLLGACPLIEYTAPASRSGKSLLAESVAIIATGKPAPATIVSPAREELRKAVTSALREGHAIVNLDNIEGPLSSPELCIAVTQSVYQDRVLGETRMLRLLTNVFWTATGNNLVLRGDLCSRALQCRIDAGMESPESRAFKIADLAEFLKNIRPQLVAAALTILRAYHVAGRPSQNIPAWGGFHEWSACIREALVWLGLADPCKTREFVLADDPEREESLAGVRSLYDVFASDKFTAKDVVERCGSDDALKGSILSVAAGYKQRQEIDSKRLGSWLRRLRGRVIGGLRLLRLGKSSGVARWQVEKVPAGGQGGLGGQVPATESKTQPGGSSPSGMDEAGQQETDHRDPYDPPNSDDEVVI